MDNNEGMISCALGCWLVAALGGLLAAVLLWVLGGWSFMQGVFVGAVVFIVAGLLMSLLLCKPLPKAGAIDPEDTPLARARKENEARAANAAAAGAAATAAAGVAAAGTSSAASASSANTASASAPGAAAATAPADATASAASGSAVKPSAELKGQQELAARKGDWKYEKPEDAPAPAAASVTGAATASTDAAASDDAAPKAAKKAPAKKAPAKKAAAKKAPAKAASDAEAKPAAAKRAPVAADGKPETLTGPRAGSTADDLKQIKGVGPGLEKTLNELGFYHFDQIASWRKKEVAWVDSRLKFKGRIERDDWIKQAKVLAKGGTTEFSSKVKKGGVY